MNLGYVLASKTVGDAAMLNGPVDPSRTQALPIDDIVWAELERTGLVEDFSVLAVGLVGRHEDGAIEGRDLERLVSIIENKAAYVDDSLADFLASLRELALAALERGVPLSFKME